MTNKSGQLYAWYVVGILTLAYTLSFIDRQILNLLVDPIRQDLQISDTQISLLQGLAFAIFYSVLGVPIARLADHKNRRNIIAVGIFLWCLMTAVCGLARNFIQLFIARIGVGIGEAALSPPAYSIIADYFPPERLARATGTYSMGVYSGAGIAMLVGGAAVEAIGQLDISGLPFLSGLRPWQLIFIIVGLPGLLVAALMFTVREPKRQHLATDTGTNSAIPVREVLNFLKQEGRTFASIFIGFSFLGIVMIGFLSWTPTFFIRLHQWSAGDVGFNYGLILLVFGTSGAVAGGWIADLMHSRGVKNAPIKTSILVSAIALPFAIAMPLVSNDTLSLIMLAPTTFLLSSPVGLSAAAIQTITPSAMRAQVTALYLLVVALMGTGFGPMAVALCTDFIFADDQAVGYSLALTSLVLIPLGVICLYLGLTPNKKGITLKAIPEISHG